MNATHTPGPWHVFPGTTQVRDEHNRIVLIARIVEEARLFAEATAMADALRTLLSLRAPATPEHDSARQMARAILARIDGGGANG